MDTPTIRRQILGELLRRSAARHPDKLAIACGDGAVRLVEIQRAGKRAMTADEFLRGFTIPRGSRIGRAD